MSLLLLFNQTAGGLNTAGNFGAGIIDLPSFVVTSLQETNFAAQVIPIDAFNTGTLTELNYTADEIDGGNYVADVGTGDEPP